MSERGTDWYKREPRAFLEGVRRLTERQIAVYAVVLDLIYDGGHQTLDDPKHIASYFSDLGLAAVRRAIDDLVQLGKLERENGFLTNKRAKNQGKTRRELAEHRRNAGRLGGLSSAKTRSNSNENNTVAEALAQANGQQVSSVEVEGEGDKNNIGAFAPSEPAPPDPFNAFWSVYPRRKGANPRKPAKAKFEKLCAAGEDPQRIIAAAARLAREHPKPTPYVPQAITFLNQERFDDDDAVPPPATDVDWAKRLKYGREENVWFDNSWGPLPGKAGCRVPASLLIAGDGEGWICKQRNSA